MNQALNWLETLAQRQHWPARTTFALTLCLDEALTNIVSHGILPDSAPTRIDITAQQDTTDIVLTISDTGPAFDPTQTQPPALATSVEHAGIGGHGVRLMRHYLKDMSYCRQHGRNQLKLTAPVQPATH